MSDAWNPAQYEKFKAQRSRPFYDLLDLVQPSSFKRVVDLGCGTGELTRDLHRKLESQNTLGIDSSSEMMKKAQAFAGAGLHFAQTSILDFKPDEPFDLVFTNAALQWLPDHHSLIPKVLSWVATSGQVAIQVPANFDHPSHVIAHTLGREMFPARLSGMAQGRSVLDTAEYATLLFREGFEDNRCRTEVYLHPLASGREVVEWTKGTMLTSFQSQLQEDEFAAFLAEYTKRVVAALGEGPYLYPFKRTLIWGQR